MPSLADTLRGRAKPQSTIRGMDGLAQNTTTEDVATLADKAGLQAPPTTAIGAGMLGANPDQQKMMGTPAQKQNALSLSLQPQQSLQSTLRTQQARTETTGQEQATIQKSADMQNLGSLGDRVNDFINTQRQLLAEQTTPAQVNNADNYNGTDLSSISDQLKQLRANPNNKQLQLQVNQFLGRDINSVISPAEIDKLYESSSSSVSRAGANTVDDSLTVDQLTKNPQFGYDANELSTLLGLPPDQIAKMNVGDLRNAIAAETQKEFSQSQLNQQQANSTESGQAERQLARVQGRDLSATGLRSSEADVAHLDQQIANADQVSFGGKQYNVDDLLKDSTISGLIKEYMDSAPDDPFRKQLETSEPQLMEFIKKNEAVLADASKNLQAGATSFKKLQDDNQAFIKLSDGTDGLDANLAAKIIPGFGKLSAESIADSNTPAVVALKQVRAQGPEAERTWVRSINGLLTTNPEYADQVKDIDPNLLVKLADPSFSTTLTNNITDNKKRLAMNDVSQLVTAASNGRFQSVADANDYLANSNILRFLGNKRPDFVSFIDQNGDGKVDSLDEVKAKTINSPTDLKTMLANGLLPPAKQTPADLLYPKGIGSAAKDDPRDANNVHLSIYNRIGKYAADGIIAPNEVDEMYKQLNDPRMGVQELSILMRDPSNSDATKQKMQQYLDSYKNQVTDKRQQALLGQLPGTQHYANLNGSNMLDFGEMNQKLDQFSNDPDLHSFGNTEKVQQLKDDYIKASIQKSIDSPQGPTFGGAKTADDAINYILANPHKLFLGGDIGDFLIHYSKAKPSGSITSSNSLW